MKISVIVPVYNAEYYLEQCLDTICNQTLKKIEIILVDDSSTDNSLSILQAYAKKDTRISIIENVHTGEGAASARNAGLAIAQGEYLSFLDADDFFALDMLEKTYAKAKECDADIVMYDAETFDDNTGARIKTVMFLNHAYLPKKEIFNASDFPDTVFMSHLPVVWTKLFRRDFIQKEQLTFQAVYHTDDILFVSGAFALAKRICILPERFVQYRTKHTGSQATNKESSPLSMVHACIAMKKQLQEKGVFDLLKNGYANYTINALSWDMGLFEKSDTFRQLYDGISTTYYDDLELESSLTKSILPFDAHDWFEKIKKKDSLAYMFYKNDNYSNGVFFRYATTSRFPETRVSPSDRVILYGGGQIGTHLYIQNLLCNFCKIVGWVDKSSTTLPHPVEPIEILKERDCDKVLIAIRHAGAVAEVKSYLNEIGYRPEQILVFENDPE